MPPHKTQGCRPRPVRGGLIAALTSTAAALLLAACGGGGSGAASDPPPVATGLPPLAMTQANASAAASLALAYGAIATSVAQQALDWTAEAEAARGLSVTQACPGGGSRSITLADRDTNGHAGPGDQLSVTLSNCYLPDLEDAYSGTLSIDFVTPSSSGALAGALSFGPQFGTTSSDGEVRLNGTLALESSGDRLGRTLHISATGGQSFAIRFINKATATTAAQDVTETLTGLDASREARRDTARVRYSVGFHLNSELLAGSLDVGTDTAWQAGFGSFPDAGVLRIQGAASSAAVQLLASSTSGLALRFGAASLDPLDVTQISPGFLWSGAPWLPLDPTSSTPPTLKAAATIGFVLLAPPATTGIQPQAGALSWQYSRPLAAQTLSSAVLHRTGGRTNTAWAGTDIPANVSIDGALLSVTPSRQLEPGSSYQIVFDNSFTRIQSAGGDTADNPSITVSVAQTVTAQPGTATLLMGPSASLTLDASASSAASGTPSAQWRQVSGPALTISGADTLHPVLRPAAAANGIAVLELSVANAAGDVDKQTLSLPVLADLNGGALAISVQHDAEAAKVYTSVDPTSGSPSYYARYFPNQVLDAILTNDRGVLRLLATLPTLQPGVEVTYGTGASTDTSVVWIDNERGVCNSAAGHLKLLDVALDGTGTLTRLALDFEESCSGARTLGSIRYDSELPLRGN